MKRIIYSLVAIVSLLAVSCVQEDTSVTQPIGSEALVSISVGNGSASRSIAQGDDTNELLYAVYDADWKLLFTRDVELPATLTYKVEEKLLTGYTYHFVFWAQKEGTYTPEWGTVGQVSDPYVTINYANANDDSRDAFFGQVEVAVQGTTNKSVDLKRPFAQINHGTNDLAKAADAGFNTAALTTSLKVSAYNTLYLNGGAVDGLTEVTFASAARDAEMTTLNTDYDWISMNYVLWTAEEESLGECTLTITDGVKTIGVKYPQAPARRNYRTNLLGALLTDSANVDVEVKPGTDGDLGVEVPIYKTVSTAADLQSAIDNAVVGKTTTITLDADIDLYETRSGVGYITRVENGSSIVIDGANHTVKGQIRIIGQSYEDTESTVIRNINFTTHEAELDFICSKDFELGNNNWRYANNVTVEGCKFNAAVSADPKVVGIRFNKSYNVVVKNCEGTNLHSLCQFQSNDTEITLENLKAVNCKNGISLGNTKKVNLNGLNIEATEYGIRADGNALQSEQRVSFNAKNATITAKQPIVIRKVTTGYDVVLGENVVLNTTELYQVIFTTGSDDAAYATPAADKYTYQSEKDFMVYPIDYAATNAAELTAAIQAGATYITIKGEIDLAPVNLNSFSGTLVGADDTAALSTRNYTPGNDEGYWLINGAENHSITFKNIDIKFPMVVIG